MDCIGSSYALPNLDCTNDFDSRWVLYGLMSGSEVEKFPLGHILRKRIQLTGTTLRNRSLQYKCALIKDFSETVLPFLFKKDSEFQPIIDKVFEMSEFAKAHNRMENSENIGKIVIQIQK